jgi:hypothetical protein
MSDVGYIKVTVTFLLEANTSNYEDEGKAVQVTTLAECIAEERKLYSEGYTDVSEMLQFCDGAHIKVTFDEATVMDMVDSSGPQSE